MDAWHTVLFLLLCDFAVSSPSCHVGFPFIVLLEKSSEVGIAL